MERTNGNATYWMERPKKLECVMCGSYEALSIVWSVSFGTTPERAEQVIVCKNCSKRCDGCEQYRVEDEITSHYASATTMCDRCRLVMHIENDRYSTLAYHRQELERWKGADGPVAFEGKRLFEELKRVERELSKRAGGA
jgi:hypothetical protein